MNRSVKLSITILFCMALVPQVFAADPKLSYQLSMDEAPAHFIGVELRIDNLTQSSIDLKMPVWAPGSYLVREFARHVESFTAADANGKTLEAGKINKNTWRINTSGKTSVIIKYKVYAFEMSVRTSFVDETHAYINGSSVFMYLDKMQQLPLNVKINPYKGWGKMSVALPVSATDKFSFTAPNYDLLADSPIEVGNHEVISFTAAGIPHEIAIYGKANYDKEKIKKDITKIAETATAIFGEHPCKNYTFIIHNLTVGTGGLEHLNSTTLQVSRTVFDNESNYNNSFLGLVAHEYFHLWNVKRIRPIALGPFNYDEENYTNMLWVAEGITNYYDDLIVRRAGYITPEKYLEIVAGNISTTDNTPGDALQSATESSFDAWIKYYRTNENSKNSTVNYYTKGGVIAYMMNLQILQATGGKKNLDDVMRFLYEEYYKKQQRGYTDEEFKKAVDKISGIDFGDFFKKYIYGTEKFNYNEYLAYAGLTLNNLDAGSTEASLGINSTSSNGRTIIKEITRGTAAWNSGLSVNDELIAMDDYRIEDLSKLIATKKPGDKVKFLINRDGIMKSVEITLGKNTNKRYKIEKIEKPSALQTEIYKNWTAAN